MPIQIKEVKNHMFTCPAGDMTFSFTIPADNQQEACKKLIDMLGQVTNELKSMLKVAAN